MSVYYFNLFYLYRLILRLLEDIFQVVNLWADVQHFGVRTLQTDFVKPEMFLLQCVCRYVLQLIIVFLLLFLGRLMMQTYDVNMFLNVLDIRSWQKFNPKLQSQQLLSQHAPSISLAESRCGPPLNMTNTARWPLDSHYYIHLLQRRMFFFTIPGTSTCVSNYTKCPSGIVQVWHHLPYVWMNTEPILTVLV